MIAAANPITAPMLPSPLLREHYAATVRARLEGIKASLRDLILDGLGDLALAFAQRPIRTWYGTRDVLARALGERRAWPEATAIIELATQAGLLVPAGPAFPDGLLRPWDVGAFTWLGARRIALTRDKQELMSYRLNGGLFDMFAMAPAMVDVEAAPNLVAIMLDSAGPYEELLELGVALAAAAVAWGAEAWPEQRVFLTERALAWTQPMGADWNREIGTALLVLECQRNEEREHLMNLASEAVGEIVGSALSDPELARNPAILATLDTKIAMLVAGQAPTIGSTQAAPGAAPTPVRGPSRERIERIVKSLPPAYAHRVGRAIARVLPPGAEKNRLLEIAARLCLEAGDTLGVAPLDAFVEPYEPAGAIVAEVFAVALERPRDGAATHAAFECCQVIGTWGRLPVAVHESLAELVGGEIAPELRIVAAAALARHGGGADSPALRAVEAAFARDVDGGSPEALAGAVGALLHLGSPEPRLAPVALALQAGDLTPRLAPLVGLALNDGLRRVPAHMDALVGLYTTLAARPEVAGAMLILCGAVTDAMQRDYELGPFATTTPLQADKLDVLLRALLPLAADIEAPQLAAEAATACAALLRGDQGFALTLVNLRAFAEDSKLKSLYDLAIGACRVFDPAVVERLARDAVQADHDVAAAASVALRLLVETFAQASHLEPWLDQIRTRIEESGEHQIPMQQLLVQLATLPLALE